MTKVNKKSLFVIESEDLTQEDDLHIHKILSKRKIVKDSLRDERSSSRMRSVLVESTQSVKQHQICCVENCKNTATQHYNLCRKHCGKKKYEREDCAICMENYSQQPLSCGHWIHFECIIKTEKKECPMCQNGLSFTREQNKQFNQYQREMQQKREQEKERIIQQRIQRRQNHREQQLLQQLLYTNNDNFMTTDLIRFINRISRGRNTLINRQELIQLLLEI